MRCFCSEVLYGNCQFTILTQSDRRSLGGKELMVGYTQTRHRIFLCIHNQFRRIGIKSIRFKSINIDFSQCSRHLFLSDITEGILFGSTGRDVSSIQFARSLKILIIPLLFGQTKTDIISISLSFILNSKLNSKAFTGINHFIIIGIDKTIHPYH